MPAVQRLMGFKEHPFQFVFSVPPRHGKTELILHFIVWALKLDPTLNIAYLTYSADQAHAKSRRALAIAQEAGLELTKAAVGEWATPKNEYVVWTGINGAVTGKGFNILIIDDPIKNRVEAESKTYRDRHWDTFQSDLITRLEVNGSVCVIQTRWHEDDLAGRLVRGNVQDDVDPWQFVNMPAIANEETDAEAALWPERWPLELLHRRRRQVGPYAWASLYQGQPRPRGASVFGDPTFFTTEPPVFRPGMGLDLAYTEKKIADYSVVVTMLYEPPTTKDGQGTHYVVRVRRKQCKAPDFKDELRLARSEYPNAPIRVYASGPEEGTVDFFRKAPNPIPIQCMPPRGDKFTRAIPMAAGWNASRVLIPAPELVASNRARYGWVNEYLDELKSFTGLKDPHDDQVDASAAAYDLLDTSPSGYRSFSDMGVTTGGRRM
jgi:predicted phage terminase large subunit-like protein